MSDGISGSSPGLDTLLSRKSVKARTMDGPGPDKKALEKILTAAMHVPDHGKLAPWRFIVLEGGEREKFGTIIKKAVMEESGTDEAVAAKMENYATQGPVLVIAVSSPSLAKPIPLWEQELSTGAACMNLLNAAHIMGYAGNWLTGWASYSPAVARELNLKDGEKIAGLIFLGSVPKDTPPARPRPSLEEKVTWGLPVNTRAD